MLTIKTPQCEEKPELNTFPGYKNFKHLILIAIRENNWLLPKSIILEEMTKATLRKLLSTPPSSIMLKDLDSHVAINKDLVMAHTIIVPEDEAWDYKWLLTYHRRKQYYLRQGLTEAQAIKKAEATTSRAANKRLQRIEGVANTHRRATRVELRASRLQQMTPEQIREELNNLDDYMDSLAPPVGGNYQAAGKNKRGK